MKYRYSSIQTAQYCLEKYNKVHIQGLKVPGPEQDHFVFGTGVHLIPQTYFEGGDPVETFKMYWRSIDPDKVQWNRYTYEEQGKMGEEFARKWLKSHAKHYKPKYVEEPIEFSIAGVTFTGTPDFVGYYKDQAVIVDWKTTANAYSPNKALVDSQLWLYREGVKQAHGFEADALVYAPFIKYGAVVQTPIVIPYTFCKAKSMIDNVMITVRDLQSRTEFPRNEGNCLRCEFLKTCFPEAK